MSKVLLISGGIDSLIAFYYLKKPKCIYVPLNTKYTLKEIACLKSLMREDKDLARKIEITTSIDLGEFEVSKNAFIPARNLLLACIALNYGDEINIIGIEGDDVSDKNPKAFKLMEKTLRAITGDKKIKIRSPFWNKSKSEIIKWFVNKYPKKINLLSKSVSCYNENKGQCGECPSCFRKWVAMKNNNLDVSFFQKDPSKTKIAKYYSKRVKDKKFNSKKRLKETKNALML